MTRWIMAMAMLGLVNAAQADSRVSLDPRIALAVERDNLMAPTEPLSAMGHRAVTRTIAPTGHARLWRTVDTMTLAVSTAALVIDWRQTRSAAQEGWSGRWEGGWAAMAIGAHPSTGAVDGYFAIAAAANVALWVALPPRWRSAIPGFLIGVEAPTVIGNLSTTHL